METKDMNLDQLRAHLETVDSIDELEQLRAEERSGKNRDGAYALIDARVEALKPSEFPTYELGQADTTFVVGHADGEVEFTTDADGKFTPTDARAQWAVIQLGATPGKE